MMILEKLLSSQNLRREEAYGMMKETMEGKLPSSQVASFLTALTIKGEAAPEIAGMAEAMREKSRQLPIEKSLEAVDNCGTGGDGKNTFNVSTTAALIAAGAGAKIAKHGNRSVTSRCGSADLLEELGVKVEMEPEEAIHYLTKYHFAFLYAPYYHRAMRHVASTRKELGFSTAFNLLGPLTNPAGVKRQVIGVSRPECLQLLAETCLLLKSEHVLLIHGGDGSDELSLQGENRILEVKAGKISELSIKASSLGLSSPSAANARDIRGGSPEINAAITRKVLFGHHGPSRDLSLLNTAAVLMVSGKAQTLEAGLEQAAKSIDQGKAYQVLENLRNEVK